jgi:hypothetical protein
MFSEIGLAQHACRFTPGFLSAKDKEISSEQNSFSGVFPAHKRAACQVHDQIPGLLPHPHISTANMSQDDVLPKPH